MKLFGRIYWLRVLEAFGVAFAGAFIPLEAGILAAFQRHDVNTAKALGLSALLAGVTAGAKAVWLVVVASATPAAAPQKPATRSRPARTNPSQKQTTRSSSRSRSRHS